MKVHVVEHCRFFENELKNFVQVCPKEMLDKLENPITLKKVIKQVS